VKATKSFAILSIALLALPIGAIAATASSPTPAATLPVNNSATKYHHAATCVECSGNWRWNQTSSKDFLRMDSLLQRARIGSSVDCIQGDDW